MLFSISGFPAGWRAANILRSSGNCGGKPSA